MIEEFDFFEKRYHKLDLPKLEKLSYSDFRQEYVSAKEALKYFQSEAKFSEAIIRGDLRLYFAVSISLNVEYAVLMIDGYEPFWKDEIDKNGNVIKLSEDLPMQLDGYTKHITRRHFDGIVSPAKNHIFLQALFNKLEKKLELRDVYLIESFKKYNYDFYKEKEYKVDVETSPMTTIEIIECQFLLSELNSLKSINVRYNEVSKVDVVESNDIEYSNEEIESDELNTQIKSYLIKLRKEASNRHIDNTKKTEIYREIPIIINELGYILNDLPTEEFGQDGLRLKVKEYLKEQDATLYKKLLQNESTFNQYWTDLMNDIKEFSIN